MGVQVAFSQPIVLWGLLKGGTSVIWCWSFGGCCEYWFCLSGWGCGKWRLGWVVGFRPYFENYTVDASIFVSQVFKGARWMPWYQEPKKDVGICDKPRGVDNQTVIRGFPNGETRLEASPVTPA